MAESLQALQRLLGMKDTLHNQNEGALLFAGMGHGNAIMNDEGKCEGFLDAPSLFQSLQSLSRRSARVFDYRGENVIGFDIAGRIMLCLPQVYGRFLKDLVGGLHTVYTKLKRLGITPVICNVEQVRSLRSLGAIQPGVNRCKLIEDKDFDRLMTDCNSLEARPGRPPKRSPSQGGSWYHAGQKSDKTSLIGQSFSMEQAEHLTNTRNSDLTLPCEGRANGNSAWESGTDWMSYQVRMASALQLLSTTLPLGTQQAVKQMLLPLAQSKESGILFPAAKASRSPTDTEDGNAVALGAVDGLRENSTWPSQISLSVPDSVQSKENAGGIAMENSSKGSDTVGARTCLCPSQSSEPDSNRERSLSKSLSEYDSLTRFECSPLPQIEQSSVLLSILARISHIEAKLEARSRHDKVGQPLQHECNSKVKAKTNDTKDRRSKKLPGHSNCYYRKYAYPHRRSKNTPRKSICRE